MNYGKLLDCDIANGPGCRVSLFVSGCRNHCPGCFNKETWDFKYGKRFSLFTLTQILNMLDRNYIRGLSILGGDPMEPENIEIVSMICRKVKKNFNGYKDIWLWTGYSFEQCLLKDSDILKYVDTLVDGPFIEELKDPTLKYRGSSNQRIIDVAKSLAKNKPIIIDERELQCLNSSSMTMSGRR